jgi:glycine/D-amino acid oxidase-like deaminating enzyme
VELYTGRLLWPDTPTAARPLPRVCRPLSKRESCDVLVVGTGTTGALTAWMLAEAGLDVVAVDRRPLSTGSTLASTAILQLDLDRRLVDLVGRYGRTFAADVYRQTRASLDSLAHTIETLGIQCDSARRPGLLLAVNDADEQILQDEVRARRAADIDCEFLDAATLRSRFGIARPGAILTPAALEFDPLKFCRGLWAHAMLAGARVYPETGIVNQRWGGVQPMVHTSTGHPIDTTHVVFATGYEAPEMFPELRSKISLKSTFVVTSPPNQQPWPERAVISETAHSYCYARTTPDGRLLIGGGDVDGVDPDRQKQLLPEKSAELIGKFAAMFPQLPPITADHAWAGVFAETADGLPFIGCARGAERCHFALGYGGNGMVLSVVAAEILRDTILARPNPAAALFGFDRGRAGTDRKAG